MALEIRRLLARQNEPTTDQPAATKPRGGNGAGIYGGPFFSVNLGFGTERQELPRIENGPRQFLPVSSFNSEAIALLNLEDWVPRSRSFDVAVRWGISLRVLAQPRRYSVTVAPPFEKGNALDQTSGRL